MGTIDGYKITNAFRMNSERINQSINEFAEA
jgi:hypothetical protein